MTTRVTFEQELKDLDHNLKMMGNFVETSIDSLAEAVETRENEIAIAIVKNARTVNDMERSIEAKCLSIITRQQPIARDLRMVSSALKAVTDMERIGNHAVDIAELLLRSTETDFKLLSEHIQTMVTAAKCMVHDAIYVFVAGNTDEAERVIESDDIVDNLFNKVKADVIENLKKELDNTDCFIDLMMIAKYLEKIGDHAVNIAEWKIFRETGAINQVRLL